MPPPSSPMADHHRREQLQSAIRNVNIATLVSLTTLAIGVTLANFIGSSGAQIAALVVVAVIAPIHIVLSAAAEWPVFCANGARYIAIWSCLLVAALDLMIVLAFSLSGDLSRSVVKD
jgi:hypothetical protein